MAGIYGLMQKLTGALSSRGDDELRLSCVDRGGVYLITLEDATAEGAGNELTVSGRRFHSMHVVSSGVTAGGVVKLQGSLDGTNWFDIAEQVVDRNGVTIVTGECVVEKVRGYLDNYADGTFSALVYSTF